MPTQVANPYESPRVASGGGLFSSGVVTPLFVAAVIFTGALFLGMLLSRGMFLEMYAEFGSGLTNPTIIAMSPWSVIVIGLMHFATIVKQFAVQHRSVVRLWNRIACLLAIVLGLCYVMAAFRPFIILVQSID